METFRQALMKVYMDLKFENLYIQVTNKTQLKWTTRHLQMYCKCDVQILKFQIQLQPHKHLTNTLWDTLSSMYPI